jgi:UDP-N-acetylglucosamine--N-acetylmuramyl-(pentapeptide) pyrophosphoryl-undecaprenol N-acetylglucosamine transferase
VDRAEARRSLGLSPDARIVLVVGGSQGSLALNEAVLEALRDVEAGTLSRPPGLELLWATGPTHLDAVRAGLGAAGNPAWVEPVGYLERMDLALGAADLAVSRAGAMATAEFLAWGLPALLVPLPTAAADHQTMNARALEASGAATHLPQAGLDGTSLWRAVAAAVGDPGRLEAQRASALRLGRPQAARVIAAGLAALLPPPPAPSRGTEWGSPERSP